MIILNGNDETVTYDKVRDKLWVKEVFYKKKLIGLNVMVNKTIIDTYSDDDCAKTVVKHLFNTQESQLDIAELNFRLEVF